MGASEFIDFQTGKTMKDAFLEAVEIAAYNYGHAGYTGTIAEKNSVVDIPIPADFEPDEEPMKRAEHWAYKIINEEDRRIDDKWGPAGGALVCKQDKGRNLYVFFGTASS